MSYLSIVKRSSITSFCIECKESLSNRTRALHNTASTRFLPQLEHGKILFIIFSILHFDVEERALGKIDKHFFPEWEKSTESHMINMFKQSVNEKVDRINYRYFHSFY